MMLAAACRAGFTPSLASFLKTPISSKVFIPRVQSPRLFSNNARSTFSRAARGRAVVSEQSGTSAQQTAINIGKGAVLGGAVMGLGALGYYGLGLSPHLGAIDTASLWPQYVKDRIKTTYMYLGASIIGAVAVSTMCSRSPSIMRTLMNDSAMSHILRIVAMMGTGTVVLQTPYKEGFSVKQVAWLGHICVIGACLAPYLLFGGPLVSRAAWHTAGAVSGLTTLALCAPNEKFLQMGGPLAVGLGVVFASCLASVFVPQTTAIGVGLHSMALYGGLILFSMLLMYDTQKIIKHAQMHPRYGHAGRPYDPINNAMSIYMDVLNIFVRMVAISGNGGKRK